MKIYNNSIFIFRRDYRLDDNTALIQALISSIFVIPIFIFTPEQITNNKFKSNNCVQFMISSLQDLDDRLRNKGSKLFYFFGKPYEIIHKIITHMQIDAVFVGRDYTPYSKLRDSKIEKVCNMKNVDWHSIENNLLYPVGSIRNLNSEIYSKYTPFYKTAKKIKVNVPEHNKHNNYLPGKWKIHGEYFGDFNQFYEYNPNIAVNGGRTNALKILDNLDEFKKYNTEKNMLYIDTSKLSAFLKFGCISVRETYYKIKEILGTKNDMIRQLYWREFYYNITEFHPNIASLDYNQKNFKQKYNKVKWIRIDNANIKQKKLWESWCNGETGFPIVDASMREMLTTGFMHNRGRLIVASFLVKNLYIHWAEGEKFFSKYLVDLDFANNTNNWLWVSGAGADSQPFFRIFNPWRQSIKYDPECEYIKKWIPELNSVHCLHIHEWYDYYNDYPNVNYYSPIIDYSKTAKKTIQRYKIALNK